MWRRVSAKLQTLAPWRSSLNQNLRIDRRLITSASSSPTTNQSPFQRTTPLFSHKASSDSVLSNEMKVEDVMPIATGHEREELEEEPAIVKSVYDKRIVGCPGGEGEDEHDVVWFWLENGKPHECPVCSQYFMLEVVGPGGPPDGHGNDNHH